jgi:uncharacterized protein (DUF4213/DUF364 family)
MTKTLLNDIIDHLRETAAARILDDVRLGLGYTAVLLDDNNLGVAFTFQKEWDRACKAYNDAPLKGISGLQALELLTSDHPLEAAVGLATANALANRPAPDLVSGDVTDAVEIKSIDQVGMVGYFAPLYKRLRERCARVMVFEQTERYDPPPDIYPAEKAFDLIPECQVALITATTLINGSIGNLLKAAESCREVVLLGSSTPLCSAPFQNTPVTCLSGMMVTDVPGMLQVVSEGGGTRRFKRLVKKVNRRIVSG